jgi:hypothetical protein
MCAGVWRVICWQGAGWRTADRVVKLSRRMEEPFGRKVEEELMFGGVSSFRELTAGRAPCPILER